MGAVPDNFSPLHKLRASKGVRTKVAADWREYMLEEALPAEIEK